MRSRPARRRIQAHRLMTVLVFLSLASITLPALAPAFSLRESQDQRYLVDQDGSPFFLMGDAAWTLVVDLTPAQVLTYLNDRQAKGYTAILLDLIERGFGGPRNYAEEHPFVGGDTDWRVRNEAYWQHIDWIMEQAEQRGIVVFAFPAYLGYGCGSQGWAQQMVVQSTAVMEDYGRWLGTRYRDFGNIVWVHGGDVNPSSCGTNPINHVEAITQGLRSTDPNHLHTAHTARNRAAVADYSTIDPNLYSVYADCSTTPSKVRDEYLRTPTAPAFHIEGKYENEGAAIACLIAQPMWSFLGGALGHFFGNKPIWLFDPGWETALGSEGSLAMANVARLFRSRPWWMYEPDYTHQVVTAGFGALTDGSYVAVGRAGAGLSVMVFAPSAAQGITVNMSKVSGTIRAWWYFPQSGLSEDLGTFSSSGTREFIAPQTSSVLVLDDDSLGFPAPGTPWAGGARPSPPQNVREVGSAP